MIGQPPYAASFCPLTISVPVKRGSRNRTSGIRRESWSSTCPVSRRNQELTFETPLAATEAVHLSRFGAKFHGPEPHPQEGRNIFEFQFFPGLLGSEQDFL